MHAHRLQHVVLRGTYTVCEAALPVCPHIFVAATFTVNVVLDLCVLSSVSCSMFVPAGTRVELSMPEVDVMLTVYSSRSNCLEFPGGCHVMVTLSDSGRPSNSTERSCGVSGMSV